MKNRCGWAKKEIFHKYHDKEWGRPVKSDRLLFEMLILEGAQAGLSFETILKKRGNYKKAFLNFDVNKVAKFNAKKKESLMKNEGIVRNRLKIESAVRNAKAFIKVQKEWGSFAKYIWHFTDGKIINNPISSKLRGASIPTSTPLSDEISKDLKKRGFNFVGTTIVYAYLQAVGIVNDHEIECHQK